MKWSMIKCQTSCISGWNVVVIPPDYAGGPFFVKYSGLLSSSWVDFGDCLDFRVDFTNPTEICCDQVSRCEVTQSGYFPA